jgi:hypothetical protein
MKVDTLPGDWNLDRAALALILDVDGDDPSIGVDVLQDDRPQHRAPALVGARLDNQVGLHLVEDFHDDPGIRWRLYGGGAGELVLEDRIRLQFLDQLVDLLGS